jgi:DNA-binding MarR family transcriptional regulator
VNALPDSISVDAWLRLRLALIRYSELGAKQSPLKDLEAPLLIALACQDSDHHCYLNQKQLSSLLKRPKASVLSQTKSKLKQKGFCKELTSAERRQLNLPVNERTKYYRITKQGQKALVLHDKITASLPISVTDQIENMPEYSSVVQAFDKSLQSYLSSKFQAIP